MFSFLQVSLLEKLKEWDQWLFIRVNRDIVNPFFDSIMPFMREGKHWAPLYVFLAVFVLINFRIRGLWWIVFFIATVAMTDMAGTYLFKHPFERLRPCGDPEFFTNVRLLVRHCGGYSFVSNHAANHVGMATFFFITSYRVIGRWAWVAFAWAALVAFAQVYVGLHYPADIVAGALLGLAVGGLTGKLFNKRYGFIIFDQPTNDIL